MSESCEISLIEKPKRPTRLTPKQVDKLLKQIEIKLNEVLEKVFDEAIEKAEEAINDILEENISK